MVHKHRLEVLTHVFDNFAILGIAQPKIDNILGLHGMDILEALVLMFKVFPLEVYSVEVLLENAIITRILKFNEAIPPKHIATEMD